MDMNEKYELALADYNQGKVSEAERMLHEILEVRSDHTEALYLLAEIAYHSGCPDDALRHLRQALQYDPENAGVCVNIGFILQGKNQLDEAMEFYQKAVRLNDSFFEAYISLGNIFMKKGQIDKAIANYQIALRIDPLSPDAYSSLGTALLKAERYNEAVLCCQRALELAPQNADMHFNLGIALQEQGRLDDAIACYRNASEMSPEDAEILNNLAFALQENRQPHEALSYYRKALLLNPGYTTAHWNLSLALLLTGNFREGWREYEWRWGTEYLLSSKRTFEQPLWDGSDIKGRTILLHAEQGFGDTFQFIRYAPLVAKSGARVILESQKQAAALMHSVEGIERVIVRGEELPAFDIHCPLLSLPLAFDTTLDTIPATVPYISADASLSAKWRDRLRHDGSNMKIGIAWAGNPGFKQNRYRNIPPHFFMPVAGIPGVTLYSLQKGEESAMAKDLQGRMKLIDYSCDISDFSDTAAFIENLDLIISVDTAVAHLAGAMGKRVWTLLPFSPEWRWLLDREDSPWYPTMRLFRQPSHNNWGAAMERVVTELRSEMAD